MFESCYAYYLFDNIFLSKRLETVKISCEIVVSSALKGCLQNDYEPIVVAMKLHTVVVVKRQLMSLTFSVTISFAVFWENLQGNEKDACF